MKQSALYFHYFIRLIINCRVFDCSVFLTANTVNFTATNFIWSREIRVGKLGENSKVGAENIWQGIERQELILDGLYNLNHLVETTALGGRQINSDQMLILKEF